MGLERKAVLRAALAVIIRILTHLGLPARAPPLQFEPSGITRVANSA
jgi:hypothetical protein